MGQDGDGEVGWNGDGFAGPGCGTDGGVAGTVVGVLVASVVCSAAGLEDEAVGTTVGEGPVSWLDPDPKAVPEPLGPVLVTPTPPTMPPAAPRPSIDRTIMLPAVTTKRCARLWDPVRPAGTVGNPWYTLGG